MVKLAANLSLMFTELPFPDRFKAASAAGFRAVEFMFPYDWKPDDLARLVSDLGLSVVLFNTPSGDWARGERGLAALPGRKQEFQDGVKRAIEYAQALNCPRLHAMAGLVPDDAARPRHRQTLIDNLTVAAQTAARHGIELLIEPINTRYDVPGYFYSTTSTALAVIDEVSATNLRLQYDIYHMQIMEGDIANSLRRLLPRIGHMQLADNPGRGEPGSGEINYHWLLRNIDGLGYEGWIGCEYRPVADTLSGLRWAKDYLGHPLKDIEA
jgi:hydroxypyruvate isomerase